MGRYHGESKRRLTTVRRGLILGFQPLTRPLTPDSGERETEVSVEARLRVEDSSGEALARETASDTATLTVERDSVSASEYGSVGGSGSLTIEIE